MESKNKRTPYLDISLIAIFVALIFLLGTKFVFDYFNLEGVEYLNKVFEKINIVNISYSKKSDIFDKDRQMYLKYVYCDMFDKLYISNEEELETNEFMNWLFSPSLNTTNVSKEEAAICNLSFYMNNYVKDKDICEFLFNDENVKCEDIEIIDIIPIESYHPYIHDIPLYEFYICRYDYLYKVRINNEEHFILIIDSLNDKVADKGTRTLMKGEMTKNTVIYTDIAFAKLSSKSDDVTNIGYIFHGYFDTDKSIWFSIEYKHNNETNIKLITIKPQGLIYDHISKNGYSERRDFRWGYNYYEIQE